MVLDAGQVPGRLSPTPATSLSPVPTTSPVDISLPVCCSKRVLRLIEGEGNKQQLLVALDLQSDRRSWRQSLERRSLCRSSATKSCCLFPSPSISRKTLLEQQTGSDISTGLVVGTGLRLVAGVGERRPGTCPASSTIVRQSRTED